MIEKAEHRAIMIAAGLGSRLAPYTDTMPKCMLPWADQPILVHTVSKLRNCGIEKIGIVTGYRKNCIPKGSLQHFENPSFKSNNILHSLMYAREMFMAAIHDNVSLIISYADLVYSQSLIDDLMKSEHDVTLAVDMRLQERYVGREGLSLDDAEKAIIDEKGKVIAVGKIVECSYTPSMAGEFVGLLKLSPNAAALWLEEFIILERTLELEKPFVHASEFQKAYVADFLQHLIEKGVEVHHCAVGDDWIELDTEYDYQQLLARSPSDFS